MCKIKEMCHLCCRNVGEHNDTLQLLLSNVNLPLCFANMKYSLQKCKYAARQSKMRAQHERTTSINVNRRSKKRRFGKSHNLFWVFAWRCFPNNSYLWWTVFQWRDANNGGATESRLLHWTMYLTHIWSGNTNIITNSHWTACCQALPPIGWNINPCCASFKSNTGPCIV